MEALQQYSSSSEGEELQGTEAEETRQPTAKRRKVAKDSDGGKVRSFPHVEGNYATHVYLEVHLPALAKQELRYIIHQARKDMPLLQTGADVLPPNNQPIADIPSNLHISLSRVVAIRNPDIQFLLDDLRQTLKKCVRFDFTLTDLEVFTNDEKERTFLALKVEKGRKEVCACIRRVNTAFVQHGLQVFYKEPRPHVSFAWLLGDEEQAVTEHIKKVRKSYSGSGMAWREMACSQQVERIACKIGRKVYDVWKAPD